MAEFPINTFKYGLDTRREQLTANVGTLVTLTNAYINEGGEIAKRGKFNDLDDYNVLDSNGSAGLFPGVFVDSTFYIFGSALAFSTTPTQSQPTLASTLSQIYLTAVYQQLKHPTLANDTAETYDAIKHRMTKLVCAEVYNGKTLAVAEFTDGNQFLYYDGELVQQSANGLVLYGRDTLADLSEDLARQFEAVGWVATENVDENAAAQNGSTMVESSQSDYFGGVLSETSTSGLFSQRNIAKDEASVQGTKASAQFSITVNAGTFQLQAPELIDTTTPLIDLCGGAVSAAGSAALTATKIAQAVNDFTDSHGYSAIADGVNVIIYAPLGYDVNVGINLTVTEAGGAATGGGAGTGVNLSATAATIPNPPGNVQISFSNNVLNAKLLVSTAQASTPGTLSAPIFLTVIGGTAPYTYKWEEESNGSGNGIFINSGSATSACVFRKNNMQAETQYTGYFKCTVKDSSAPQLSLVLNFTVQLSMRITS